jgi:hypothetical protein
MDSLRTALQLYKADQGAYPPRLLGYVTGYSDVVPSGGDIVPADRVVGALFPKRVDSVRTFQPALVRANAGSLETEFTTAEWPNVIDAQYYDTTNNRKKQRYRLGDGNVKRCIGRDEALKLNRPDLANSSVDALFYRLSGYDAATVTTPAGPRTELRYTLFWSAYAVPENPCPGTQGYDATGSAGDDPRQLGYLDPPDSTVVTWNSAFREYTNGMPNRGRQDIVLFLGGNARPYDSLTVFEQAYQARP